MKNSYFTKKLTFNINNFIVNIRALKIKNKVLKRRYKNFCRYYLANGLCKRLKWGISYSVFDGIELLEKSIISIRNNCDYINVVYQNKSWYGEDCPKELLETIEKLKEKGYVDELIEYKPNFKLSAGKQELLKRNIGLKYVKKAKCDFFMTMDTDEFYNEKELHKAKVKICQQNITNSYCFQKKYVNQTSLIINDKSCAVPLWSKINKYSRLKSSKSLITTVDPTRQVSRIFNRKDFVLTEIYMHHYSFFRKDLDKKFRNSSFQGHIDLKFDTINIDNYFNL